MSLPVLQATQVGIGATAVEAAAWAVLLGGLVVTALWVKRLYA